MRKKERKKKMKKENKGKPALTIAYIILLIMVWTVVAFGLMTSCTTSRKAVEQTTIERDTIVKVEYVNHHDSVWLRDSVWLHDSVLVNVKGDSVTIDRWHTKYVAKYKDKIVKDTVYLQDKQTKEAYISEKKVVKDKKKTFFSKVIDWIEAILAIIGIASVVGVIIARKRLR